MKWDILLIFIACSGEESKWWKFLVVSHKTMETAKKISRMGSNIEQKLKSQYWQAYQINLEFIMWQLSSFYYFLPCCVYRLYNLLLVCSQSFNTIRSLCWCFFFLNCCNCCCTYLLLFVVYWYDYTDIEPWQCAHRINLSTFYNHITCVHTYNGPLKLSILDLCRCSLIERDKLSIFTFLSPIVTEIMRMVQFKESGTTPIAASAYVLFRLF